MSQVPLDLLYTVYIYIYDTSQHGRQDCTLHDRTVKNTEPEHKCPIIKVDGPKSVALSFQLIRSKGLARSPN